ncbi:MAG: sugar phosphate isomerase/epimerase, partial [Candidatus Aminicenantes bacterium]|nr:sugar phosphate isomerase/epimerase [Candidatus Aminicenantes bacterium]
MGKTTRRTFLGSSLAAAAGAALGTAASCGGRNPMAAGPAPGFKLGLASYTFREFDLDAALAMACRVGLDRITLKDMHLPLDSSDEDIRATVEKVKAGGLVPYGCGVVYMTGEAEVDRAFGYARAAGMGIIIGVPEHGLLERAQEQVRETGILLAIHNHGPGDPRYPTPGSILDRIAGLDARIGLCLDIGHCARSGLDPSDEAARCGPRLLDVHMKDVSASAAEGATVEVGRGVIDIPRFLKTLAGMGYRGTLAFEHE